MSSDNVLYAAAGQTTLADVVSCFTEPELDDAIITALRGMKIPKPQPKPQQPATVTAPMTAIKLKPKVHTVAVAAKADNVPTIHEKFSAPAPSNVVELDPTIEEKKEGRPRFRGGKKKRRK